MADTTRNPRTIITALVAITALLLLLAAGGIWAWRSGKLPETSQQTPAGPIAKVSTWVEPPAPTVKRSIRSMDHFAEVEEYFDGDPA